METGEYIDTRGNLQDNKSSKKKKGRKLNNVEQSINVEDRRNVTRF